MHLFRTFISTRMLEHPPSNEPSNLNTKIIENKFILSAESGEVFDMNGRLAFKFPGGYPIVLGNGEYIVTQDGQVTRFRRDGKIKFQFQGNFTHDWDISESEDLYYFSRLMVKEGNKKLRSAEIMVVDKNGQLKDKYSFHKNKKKLEEKLGIDLVPIFFSFNHLTRKFGRPLSCNCWEFEHFNYIQFIKSPLVISEKVVLPKGTLLTSLPFHQRLIAFEPNSFEILWNLELPGIHFFHTPVFTQKNTVLIFANNFREEDKIIEKSGLVEFDINTGKEVFRFLFPDELYSPINGSIQYLDEERLLISIMTGEIFLFSRNLGLEKILDLRKNYLDRQIDFHRAIIVDKDYFQPIGDLKF